MPATGPKNITTAALKRALRKHAGVYVLAARELGCDRSNVKSRVNRSPELQAFVQGLEDEIGDVAVGTIYKAIIGGDVNVSLQYARLKLKDRGFSPRVENTGLDGAPLQSAPPVSIVVNYVNGSPEPAGDEEDVI